MAGPVLGALLALHECQPTLALAADWFNVVRWIVICVLGLLAGFFIAIVFGACWLPSLYLNRSVKNGHPFREGDLVHILVGPHRDRIVRVLEVRNLDPWLEYAHRVYVDLGKSVAKEGEDVFDPHQILLVAREELESQTTREGQAPIPRSSSTQRMLPPSEPPFSAL
jgi:hypothetical protein